MATFVLERQDLDFLAPRRCMRDPIPDLAEVAALLDSATEAHMAGDHKRADSLLREADRPAVRAWTESLWGSKKANPDQWRYRRLRQLSQPTPYLAREERVAQRKPNAAERAAIIAAYGRHCVFCTIPLIRAEIRFAFHHFYPQAVPWGSTNSSCHAAFQAMWLQFDHLVPHSRGGDNSLSNVVVTCAGCNYGRMCNTIEELGLLDPRTSVLRESDWDGLERILHGPRGAGGIDARLFHTGPP